jgi:hypothetical protein
VRVAGGQPGSGVVDAEVTAGCSTGQILGPLAVTPLLHHGYHQALAVASVTVLAAAIAAGILWIGFPHRMPAGDTGTRKLA